MDDYLEQCREAEHARRAAAPDPAAYEVGMAATRDAAAGQGIAKWNPDHTAGALFVLKSMKAMAEALPSGVDDLLRFAAEVQEDAVVYLDENP